MKNFLFLLLFFFANTNFIHAQCPGQISTTENGSTLVLDFSPNQPPTNFMEISADFGVGDARNGEYFVSTQNTNTWVSAAQGANFFTGPLAATININGNSCSFDGEGTGVGGETGTEKCDRWIGPCNTTDRIKRTGSVGIGSDSWLSSAAKLSVGTSEGIGILASSAGSSAIWAFSSHDPTMFVQNNAGGRAAEFVGGVSVSKGLRVVEDITTEANVYAEGKVITPRAEISEFLYAKEIHVKLPPFPDYVFAPDYNLLPLAELEKYIDENQHLPNIPSAEEVAENGASVGEMQVKQMEKIEELTLYILELNKRLNHVEEENRRLQIEVKR